MATTTQSRRNLLCRLKKYGLPDGDVDHDCGVCVVFILLLFFSLMNTMTDNPYFLFNFYEPIIQPN